MNLSSSAQAMLAFIQKKGGGRISEWSFRTNLNVSHGTFCKARNELCREGLIQIARDGHTPVYKISEAESDKLPVVHGRRSTQLLPPVIDGIFQSREDWETAVGAVIDGATIFVTATPYIYKVTGNAYRYPRSYCVVPYMDGVRACGLLGGSNIT